MIMLGLVAVLSVWLLVSGVGVMDAVDAVASRPPVSAYALARVVRTWARLAWVRLALRWRLVVVRVRYSRRVEWWVRELKYGTPRAPRWMAAAWDRTAGLRWLLGAELVETVRELAGMVRPVTRPVAA